MSGPKTTGSVEKALGQGFVVTKGPVAGDWGHFYEYLCCCEGLPTTKLELRGSYVYLSVNIETAGFELPTAY